MERINDNFKGIWIPKNLWFMKELSIIEKIFMVEIISLDNEKGCFASNKYFSSFFDITRQRCSQIINKLKSNGYIRISYQRAGNEIIKRTIRVSRKFTTLVN